MPIYYNNQKIKDITFQNTSIGKGYYGSTLVYQKVIPFTLTVNNGTGSGSYPQNTNVNINANAAPINQIFDNWTRLSGSGSFANANIASTVYTTGNSNTVIQANYRIQTFTLTVNNGTGSGTYANNTNVNIVANAAPSGQVFNNWTRLSGSGSFANANIASTVYTTGNSNTVIQANFRNKVPITVRPFSSAGSYNWTVPAGVTSVDVFLVGGGAGAGSGVSGGGAGGYTATFLNITVTPGQVIPITIGSGGAGNSYNGTVGGYSQFLNTSYRANGGNSSPASYRGGNGGSGGGGTNGLYGGNGGSNGSNGSNSAGGGQGGTGQGTTTRDFGESTGKINAGGGGGTGTSAGGDGGVSDYYDGAGSSGGGGYDGAGGGGYGGGGGAGSGTNGGPGGDGTCLIRYLG